MKSISRAESRRSQGWLVRMYRAGKTYSKFFGYRKYGGKLKALHQAQTYLQSLEQEFPPSEKPPFRAAPLRHNKTGVNGVCLTFDRDRNGAKLPCYSVYYRLGGQDHNKRFYLHWYEDAAFALKEAAHFRKAMETAMLREWKKHRRRRT